LPRELTAFCALLAQSHPLIGRYQRDSEGDFFTEFDVRYCFPFAIAGHNP
jgi:hypothetical protein